MPRISVELAQISIIHQRLISLSHRAKIGEIKAIYVVF